MPTSSRDAILEASLVLLRDPDGPALTLESAAKQAGLSKPGLMYHFPTKLALLRGVAEHVGARWEQRMEAVAGGPVDGLDTLARYRAYVAASLADDLDRADLATFFSAHLRGPMHEVWTARIGPWLALPDDLDPDVRGRLVAARLAADGFWIAAVADLLRPDRVDRGPLERTLDTLLADLR